MPFHPQRIHYETSLFWDCLAPQIQKRLILVVVDHFVVGLVCWVTIISSISSQYRFVDSQWQPLPMMATGSHTNPYKMIQTTCIVTLHLHSLQSESHVLHIQTWSLCISTCIWQLHISHHPERWQKGKKETLLLTSWVWAANEIFLVRWAIIKCFVERYEFTNKQAQLKTVIDKMGDASTRVSFTCCFKILEELHDLCSLLPLFYETGLFFNSLLDTLPLSSGGFIMARVEGVSVYLD